MPVERSNQEKGKSHFPKSIFDKLRGKHALPQPVQTLNAPVSDSLPQTGDWGQRIEAGQLFTTGDLFHMTMDILRSYPHFDGKPGSGVYFTLEGKTDIWFTYDPEQADDYESVQIHYDNKDGKGLDTFELRYSASASPDQQYTSWWVDPASHSSLADDWMDTVDLQLKLGVNAPFYIAHNLWQAHQYTLAQEPQTPSQ